MNVINERPHMATSNFVYHILFPIFLMNVSHKIYGKHKRNFLDDTYKMIRKCFNRWWDITQGILNFHLLLPLCHRQTEIKATESLVDSALCNQQLPKINFYAPSIERLIVIKATLFFVPARLYLSLSFECSSLLLL